MPLRRENALKTVLFGLAQLVTECRVRGPLGLLDGHTIAHHFFCRFLNEVFDLKLVVLDRLQRNFPALDLGDEENRRAFQVTAERTGDKIQSTINAFTEHDLRARFGKLQFLIIGDRQRAYQALHVPEALAFTWQDDIIDVPRLSKLVEALDTDKLERLSRIVSEEICLGPTEGAMSIHVSAHRAEPRLHWHNGDETRLYYESPSRDGTIVVHPRMGYLDRLKSGGPIEALRYQTATYCPFDWEFPALDFKFLNSATAPYFLAEAVFEIEESRATHEPAITIKKDVFQSMAGYFVLVNESETALSDVVISFNIHPGEIPAPDTFPSEYQFSESIEKLAETTEVSVVDALAATGADVETLSKLTFQAEDSGRDLVLRENGSETRISYEEAERAIQKALGPYSDLRSTVLGAIEFGLPSDRRQVTFRTIVYVLNENRRGLPKPPSFLYNVQFEPSRTSYKIRLPVSQEIKPGESDRFLIRIDTRSSSFHRFRVVFHDVGKRTITSPTIELTSWIPRTLKGTTKKVPVGDGEVT